MEKEREEWTVYRLFKMLGQMGGVKDVVVPWLIKLSSTTREIMVVRLVCLSKSTVALWAVKSLDTKNLLCVQSKEGVRQSGKL